MHITAITFLKILIFLLCKDLTESCVDQNLNEFGLLFSIRALGLLGNLGGKNHSELETVLIHGPQP